jgi:hypothetical protein
VSLRGRWRVVDTPGYDMATSGSYILFDEDGGEFAVDCLTGSIYGSCEGDAVDFEWDGNDEMDEASGSGWAKLRPRRLPRRRNPPPKWRRHPLHRPPPKNFFNSLLVPLADSPHASYAPFPAWCALTIASTYSGLGVGRPLTK